MCSLDIGRPLAIVVTMVGIGMAVVSQAITIAMVGIAEVVAIAIVAIESIGISLGVSLSSHGCEHAESGNGLEKETFRFCFGLERKELSRELL